MKKQFLDCAVTMLMAISATVAAKAEEPSTWWVNATNYVEGLTTPEEYIARGFDGTTPEKGFGTIQIGIDSASAGDAILVLPGTYDKGSSSAEILWSETKSRVEVVKRLHIRSTGGKDVTHIVGAPDPETGSYGPNAMRCLLFAPNAAGSVVEGFTLRNGYSAEGTGWGGRGGACLRNGDASYLVDCVVSNSVSSYSAVFQVNCVRCEITGNQPGSSTTNPHVYNSTLVNCLVHDNGYVGSILRKCRVYNTTVANERASYALREVSCLCNSIIENSANFHEVGDETNSVHDTKALLAPAVADFRPRADSVACFGGEAELLANLEVPDVIDLYKDLANRPIAKSGPIHMGCYQDAAPCAGGRVDFTYDSNVDNRYAVNGGVAHKCSSYAFAETYPTQYIVTAGPSARPVFGSYEGATFKLRPPDLNDAFGVMPPPSGTMKFTLTPADAELWVSESGSDTTGDGAQATPFKSIQKAIDEADAAKKTIVNVAPGTYGVGEAHYPKDNSGNDITAYKKAAVTVYDKCVRVVGAEGAERTVIKGTSDADYADDATLPGCGPNAARCVILGGSSDNGSSLSGFTLTGGATDRTGSDGETYGGGYLCPNGCTAIADCIVSNNAAAVCAGGFGCVAQRCFFTDNRGSNATAGGVSGAILFGCIFVNNPSSRGTSGAIRNDTNTFVYHCTLIGEGDAYVYAEDVAGLRLMNSIVLGGNQNCPKMKRSGNIIWGGVNPDRRVCETYEDPLFADMGKNDYRIKAISCARGAGDAFVEDYSRYAATAFGGRRLVFTGGTPLSGAVQEIVVCGAEAYVTAEHGGFVVSCGRLGYLNLDQTGNIELSPFVGTRPCIGYLVNGTTNMFADLPGGKLEISAAAATVAGGFNVQALYDNSNWYVDAENGSDSNPGCAAYPLLTLEGAMRNAVDGDTVHAAPGDYNQGLMIQSDSFCISSRVVVAAGVRLIADRGPDVTYVTGADATVGAKTGTYAGCGSNAVRCVYLRDNACIEGFTIRNGRFNGESPNTEDSRSGGVYGASPKTSIAYGCVVTNCWGYRGGNAYSACLVNCLVVDGKSQQGSAGFLCSYHGCCIRGDNSNNCQIYQPRGFGVSGCTIDTVSSYASLDNVETSYAGSISNTVFLSGVIKATEEKPIRLVNCAVAEGCITDAVRPYITLVDSPVTNREAIAIGADWRPLSGSLVIDAGLASAVHPLQNGRDMTGGQRIYNGKVDIGAVEYDWRADYAAALGDRVSVVLATPGVSLTGGKLKLTEDDILSGIWSAEMTAHMTTYSLSTSAAGGGTLEGLFTAGGDVRKAFSVTDGVEVQKFKSKDAELAFEFGFAGEGFGLLSDFCGQIPGLVLIVR